MTQYILLIQGNTKTSTTPEEWERFFAAARESGLFKGGSELGSRMVLGDLQSGASSSHITGYMRFDAEDTEALLELLQLHPVLLHGGTAELCEMPKT